MHILLVRFSSMGDVVLQTATVNWLRSHLGKEVRFTFVTSSEFSSLLDSHPEISNVISFDRRKGETWKSLIHKINQLDDREPIDLILDLHATLRSLRLKFSFWNIPALTIDKRRWERFLLTKIKSIKLKNFFRHKFFGLESQVERVIKDFETIFFDPCGIRRTIDYRRGSQKQLTSLGVLPPFDTKGDYIVFAPSASFVSKRWPIGHFVSLAKKLLDQRPERIVILAGPDDKFCDAFNSISSPRLLNLQGKTSLKESMSILSYAKLCVGNDSGMNHIAEAACVPVITIFGPTDPLFGFSPHGMKSRYLSKEMTCKPCSTTGKTPCSRERHFCMEDISPHEVLVTLKEILESR